MPDRIYLPLNRNHYRRRDRLGAHWFAFCATMASSGLGLMIVVTSFIRTLWPYSPDSNHDGMLDPPWEYTGWHRWLTPAPSLATIPHWQGTLLGVILLVGGLLWLIATLTEFKYVEDFWKVLRAGLLMLTLGWLGYVFCAVSARPEWAVPWWIGLAYTTAYSGGFFLSLLHQWRLKGFPDRALRVGAVLSPSFEFICRVFAAPFEVIERWLGRHSLTRARQERMGAPVSQEGSTSDVE